MMKFEFNPIGLMMYGGYYCCLFFVVIILLALLKVKFSPNAILFSLKYGIGLILAFILFKFISTEKVLKWVGPKNENELMFKEAFEDNLSTKIKFAFPGIIASIVGFIWLMIGIFK